MQIETDNKDGSITKLSINWTDECKYELKLIESNANFPDSVQEIRKTIPLNVEILNWTDDYYIYSANRANSDYTMIDTLWIQK